MPRDRPDQAHGSKWFDERFPKPPRPQFLNYVPDYYFKTIDWPREHALDRIRYRRARKRHKSNPQDVMRKMWDNCLPWFCVFLIGGVCGVLSLTIDIGTEWLSDLKEGFCSSGFWFNKHQCCWYATEFIREDETCKEWHPWSHILGYYVPDMLSEHSRKAYYFQYASYVLWALCFSMTAGMLVYMFAPYAGEGGIPEIKVLLSGYIIPGMLSKWTLLITAVGIMLTVAAGLVVGKEGPLVHIACCVGNLISHRFSKYNKNEAKKREILSAAAAAGVAVAFGAPIGGVLFSLEEVSYYFPPTTMWRTFFCALIGFFTMLIISPYEFQTPFALHVDYETPWVIMELLPFAVLGMLGGIVASVFIKASEQIYKLRTKLWGNYPLLEIAVITFVTALISYPIVYTRLNTSELLIQLLQNCHIDDENDLCDHFEFTMLGVRRNKGGEPMIRAIWQLAVTLLIKFVLCIVSIRLNVPAGLYVPSLAIGAIIGRIMGLGVEQLAIAYPDSFVFHGSCSPNCATPGLYALVGGAAMLTGVTRMTVSIVVVVFEVTGGIRYIIPVMTAVLFSKWIGDAFGKNGIFECLIELNDYPYLDVKEEFHHGTVTSQVMRPKEGDSLIVLTQTTTLEMLEYTLQHYGFNGFPIVYSEIRFNAIGYVLRKELVSSILKAKAEFKYLPDDTIVYFADNKDNDENEDNDENDEFFLDFRNIVQEAIITVTKRTPMEAVVEMFKVLGLRQLFIIDRKHIIGIITKKDVAEHVEMLKRKAHEKH